MWSENSQPCVDECVVIMHAFELVSLLIKSWQSVARAVDYSKDLRKTQGEINQLWDEKEHHSLGKVTKDSDNGKSHSSAVAESISNENSRWELVMLQKSKSAEQERNHNSQ